MFDKLVRSKGMAYYDSVECLCVYIVISLHAKKRQANYQPTNINRHKWTK